MEDLSESSEKHIEFSNKNSQDNLIIAKELLPDENVQKSFAKEPSYGELFLPSDFQAGDCQAVTDSNAKDFVDIPQVSESDLRGHNVERAIDLGDKLLVFGGYRDKFLYLYGSEIASEAKRKDFTIFLRSSGILEMISRFILALQDMPVRPPPDQVMEMMLKSKGTKLAARGILNEMKDYKDKTSKRIEELENENEKLRLRLENYTTLYTNYEVLDPDDFSQLGNQSQSIVLPPPPTSPGEEDQEPPTKSIAINTSMLNILDEVLKKVKNTKVEVPEVVLVEEELVEASESGQISKKSSSLSTGLGNQMTRRQVVQEAQEKYSAMAKVEREDLDMEGLAEYFSQLKPLQTETKDAEEGGAKVEPQQGSQVGGDCSLLPLIEIKDDNGIRSGDKKGLRLPPLILMQMRKFTASTQTFDAPKE